MSDAEPGEEHRMLPPHRGVLVLSLGILSLLLCGPLGVFAWVMGRRDLAAMRQGLMDRSGEGMTSVGTVLGIVGAVLFFVCALPVVGMGIGSWAYMRQLETAREKTAQVTIKHLTQLVDTYKTDTGDYPDSLQVLTLPEGGKPPYCETKDLIDPWGQPYVYEPQNRSPATGTPRISSTHQTGGQPIANW
jgi:hypothetical protein